MANRYYVGISGGAWNTTANWSASSGGASGASVPTSGDDVFIDKAVAAISFINVNQDIGSVNSISFPSVGGSLIYWRLAGGSASTAGTTWTLPSASTPVTISVTSVASSVKFASIGVSTVGGKFIKTGGGGFGRDTSITTLGTGWGATDVDLQQGWIGVGGIDNAIGSGTITMSAGTSISTFGSGTARSMQNPIVVNGDVFLGRYLDATTTAAGALTLTGTLDLGSTKRSITHGDSGSALNRVFVSGAVSGTNGVTITSSQTRSFPIQTTAGCLQFTSVSSGFSGVVDLTNTANLILGGTASIPATTSNVWPNVSGYTLTQFATLTVQGNTAYTFPSSLSGTGNGRILCSDPAGITLPTLVNLTNSGASIGFGPYINNADSYVNVTDFPQKLCFDALTSGTGHLKFVGTTGSNLTANTTINIQTITNTVAAIYANGTSGSSLTLAGGISHTRPSGAIGATLTLRGTNTDNNTVSGVISSGTGNLALTKDDSGTWVLSNTNTYGGTTTLTAGTLVCAATNCLGASGSIVTLTSGTLKIQGDITLTKTAAVQLNGSAIENVSGTNTLAATGLTFNTSTTFLTTAGTLVVSGNINNSSTTPALTKSGSGTLDLTATLSNYLGTTTIRSGTVRVRKLSSAGLQSSLGSPALAQATIALGADGSTSLIHAGTSGTDTTDRVITFAGGSGTTVTIGSSGTGTAAVNFLVGGAFTITGAGTHTVEFSGTNTVSNTFARTIADTTDGGGGATSILKSGTNTWTLTGTITATGTVTCSGGVLDLGSTNRSIAAGLLTTGGTVQITNGNTVAANVTMNGGTITAVLTGANTVAVQSGATEVAPAKLQPDDATNGNNAITGAVTVAGCLDLVTPTSLDVTTAGKGRVLGTSNTTTVSSGGVLRTYASPAFSGSASSSVQDGHARYNNLTLQNGSALKIGLAA